MAGDDDQKFQLPMSKPLYGLFALSGMVTSGAIIFGAYNYGCFIPVPSSLGIGARLGYACKWLLLPTLNVFIAINESGMARGKHNAHPLAGKDHLFQLQKNVLMNTIEQYCLFALPLLALGASVQSAEQLRLIPALCITFFIGRILFRIGYPNYRAFGYIMNFSAALFNFGTNAYFAVKYGFLSGLDN